MHFAQAMESGTLATTHRSTYREYRLSCLIRGSGSAGLGEYDDRPDRSRWHAPQPAQAPEADTPARHSPGLRTRRAGTAPLNPRPPRGAQSSVRTKFTRASATVGAGSSVRTKMPRGSPDRRQQLTDAEIASANRCTGYKRRLMHRLDRRDHRQEQRPSTTLNSNSTNRSRPDNRARIKPATIQREPVSKRRTVRGWDGPPGPPGSPGVW